MQAVILGAGRGSRMGKFTSELPKPFLTVNDRPILQWQLDAIAGVCDQVTLVLGYGFEDEDSARSVINETVSIPDSLDVDVLHLSDWEEYENGWSCCRALESDSVSDEHHTLLVCGDVIFSDDVLAEFESDFRVDLDSSCSYVVTIEGMQDEMTAIRSNERGYINDYGAIEGHQEAGIFLLNAAHFSEAIDILGQRPNDWFPVVFPEIRSKPYYIDPGHQVEINTPRHLNAAQNSLPFHTES